LLLRRWLLGRFVALSCLNQKKDINMFIFGTGTGTRMCSTGTGTVKRKPFSLTFINRKKLAAKGQIQAFGTGKSYTVRYVFSKLFLYRYLYLTIIYLFF
jgi:hypothetical protein